MSKTKSAVKKADSSALLIINGVDVSDQITDEVKEDLFPIKPKDGAYQTKEIEKQANRRYYLGKDISIVLSGNCHVVIDKVRGEGVKLYVENSEVFVKALTDTVVIIDSTVKAGTLKAAHIEKSLIEFPVGIFNTKVHQSEIKAEDRDSVDLSESSDKPDYSILRNSVLMRSTLSLKGLLNVDKAIMDECLYRLGTLYLHDTDLINSHVITDDLYIRPLKKLYLEDDFNLFTENDLVEPVSTVIKTPFDVFTITFPKFKICAVYSHDEQCFNLSINGPDRVAVVDVESRNLERDIGELLFGSVNEGEMRYNLTMAPSDNPVQSEMIDLVANTLRSRAKIIEIVNSVQDII